MDPNTFPTKGNLILAKNSLALALQGFDLNQISLGREGIWIHNIPPFTSSLRQRQLWLLLQGQYL